MTAKLEPSLAKSDLTAELVPVSQSLHQVAEIGLQALDALKQGSLSRRMFRNRIWRPAGAEKPQAALLLMVAPSVELLVKSGENTLVGVRTSPLSSFLTVKSLHGHGVHCWIDLGFPCMNPDAEP
jgi:hypothetical protein